MLKTDTALPPTTEVFNYESTLEACARGDRVALRALYEHESRWLLGVAQRIVRNREAAHDVLQDAFLQIWQRAGSYQRSLGSARGWVYTVVRHRALDVARRDARETPAGDDIDNYAEVREAADADAALPAIDAHSLARCLEELDERKRTCVVHAFVDGYTHEQIAKRLSSPVGTVKSWIRRGLISLKECLS